MLPSHRVPEGFIPSSMDTPQAFVSEGWRTPTFGPAMPRRPGEPWKVQTGHNGTHGHGAMPQRNHGAAGAWGQQTWPGGPTCPGTPGTPGGPGRPGMPLSPCSPLAPLWPCRESGVTPSDRVLSQLVPSGDNPLHRATHVSAGGSGITFVSLTRRREKKRLSMMLSPVQEVTPMGTIQGSAPHLPPIFSWCPVFSLGMEVINRHPQHKQWVGQGSPQGMGMLCHMPPSPLCQLGAVSPQGPQERPKAKPCALLTFLPFRPGLPSSPGFPWEEGEAVRGVPSMGCHGVPAPTDVPQQSWDQVQRHSAGRVPAAGHVPMAHGAVTHRDTRWSQRSYCARRSLLPPQPGQPLQGEEKWGGTGQQQHTASAMGGESTARNGGMAWDGGQ